MRLALLSVLSLAACGASSTPAPGPSNAAGDCPVEACGPALGMPAQSCADGSVGGNTGRCQRHDDGTCTWEIRECPAGADEGAGGAEGAAGACIKTGCSGTVCAEPGNDVMTTCEFKPEYACYQQATCERQAGGACGWTQTAELAACLASPPTM